MEVFPEWLKKWKYALWVNICWALVAHSGWIQRESSVGLAHIYSHNIRGQQLTLAANLQWKCLQPYRTAEKVIAVVRFLFHASGGGKGLQGIRCFLSAISSVLLPQRVSLMEQVNHTAIREKMNHWNNCNDLHSESFTRESTRPWFIQCSVTPWRSLSARILDTVLKARLHPNVSPLSFMTSDSTDDDLWQECAACHAKCMSALADHWSDSDGIMSCPTAEYQNSASQGVCFTAVSGRLNVSADKQVHAMIFFLVKQFNNSYKCSHKNKLKHKLNIFFGRKKNKRFRWAFFPYHYQGAYDFTHVCLFVS